MQCAMVYHMCQHPVFELPTFFCPCILNSHIHIHSLRDCFSLSYKCPGMRNPYQRYFFWPYVSHFLYLRPYPLYVVFYWYFDLHNHYSLHTSLFTPLALSPLWSCLLLLRTSFSNLVIITLKSLSLSSLMLFCVFFGGFFFWSLNLYLRAYTLNNSLIRHCNVCF